MSEDEKYMHRCIELAQRGRMSTMPNPMVGAVIVHQGRIIGEGYHIRPGEGHAEVNAVASVKEADRHLLTSSTIYVSLEPCSHYGKTPPCADLIIRTGIPRVVVGCVDPFAQVQGRGIQKLRDAGCEVITGVLERECQQLNHVFMTFHSKKRPYVILKWAQSSDGYLDRDRKDRSEAPLRLSSSLSSLFTHQRRAFAKAILIGTRTAQLDNPSLTCRNYSGPDPIRVVIDRDLKLEDSLRIFDGTVLTIVFYSSEIPNDRHLSGVEYESVDFSKDIIPQILDILHSRGIQSLLVEGGARTHLSFLESGLWDEVQVEESPVPAGGGVSAPDINRFSLNCQKVQILGRTFRFYHNFP